MKIITCRDVTAAMSSGDTVRQATYALLTIRHLADLERKYIEAGEPGIAPLSEAQGEEMSRLMALYTEQHPAHPMKAAIRSAYFATRTAILGSPTTN